MLCKSDSINAENPASLHGRGVIAKKRIVLVGRTRGLLLSIAPDIVAGRNVSDKLKILVVYVLRMLQRLAPFGVRRYFDLMMEGTVIQTDVKFFIRTLHDFFVMSLLWEKNPCEDDFALDKGMIFLDVGAHIGAYTLRAAKMVEKQGRVVSVEPNKDNFELLIRNIGLNDLGNCIPLNVAAYSANEEVILFDGPDSAQHSIKARYERPMGSSKVKARTLDGVMEEIGIKRLDMVKIDVEGAELEVLKGMEKTLIKNNPNIILEILKEDQRKVIEYLNHLGYDGELDKKPYFPGDLAHYCLRKGNHARKPYLQAVELCSITGRFV
jgi:FkbM family methyltransferase